MKRPSLQNFPAETNKLSLGLSLQKSIVMAKVEAPLQKKKNKRRHKKQKQEKAPQIERISLEGVVSLLESYKPPHYPHQAIRKRWEADIIFDVKVEKGRVIKAKIIKASPYDILNQEASKSIHTFLFKDKEKSFSYQQKISFVLF